MKHFKQHHHATMGIFIESIDDEVRGQQEIEWHFNLQENPELANQYLEWLAAGNTPEPWNPEPAPVNEAQPSTDAG